MTQIIYFLDSQGNNSIRDFINSLPKSTQAKIFRIFLTIETYHLQSILPHLKKLTGTPLWEIRILGKDNVRIFYIAPTKDSVLLLHGFIKKTDKTPAKDIDIALRRYQQHLDK